MKNCSIRQVKKDGKTYFRCNLEYKEGKVLDFAIEPKFLTKKQYVFLLRLTADENK